MTHSYLTRKSNEEYIDPATEDKQEELLREAKKLKSATNDLKAQKVTCTTANTAYAPKSHGCKGVKIITADADVYIDFANGDVTLKEVLLKAEIWLELPINNVSNLRFLGATGGKIVRLISYN